MLAALVRGSTLGAGATTGSLFAYTLALPLSRLLMAASIDSAFAPQDAPVDYRARTDTDLGLAPSLLRRFRSLYPGVELSLHHLPMTAQMERLSDQTIDIGFVMLPVHDERYETRLMMRNPLVVAVPTGHPLKRKKSISLKSIEPYDLIMFTRTGGLGFFSHVLAMSRKAGFVPTIAQEVATMEAVIGLVAADVGISVVPSIAKQLRIAGVEYLPLREGYAAMEFAIAWRKDNASPVVRAFVELAGRSIPRVNRQLRNTNGAGSATRRFRVTFIARVIPSVRRHRSTW